MSLWAFLLQICYLNLITRTYSQCQYVAYNWDLVLDSSKTGAIRKYVDDGFAYLPPLPKLFGGVDNETFAKIPYPTDVCLQTDNHQDTDVVSYKFKCKDGGLRLQIWKGNSNCADHLFDEVDPNYLFDTDAALGLLDYKCDSSDPPCQYISINEEYFVSDKCTHTLNGVIYQGTYAVDVCLGNNIGSFKYWCDDRTKTYSLTQYSDTNCVEQSHKGSMQIGLEECTYNTSLLEVINNTEVITESLLTAQSTFINCTSADEFELAFPEYCVASQLYSINDDNWDVTSMTQFGPFGMNSVVEKKVSRIVNCDPCNVTTCNLWDDTILIIDEHHTHNITQCGAKQFVMDIQDTDIAIHAIIFASDTKISDIHITNSVVIPTRVMPTNTFQYRYFQFFEGNESVSTKVASLSCNYRDGYPKEVCVTVTCDDLCNNIDYGGTYFIQNTSDSYNANPIWIKQSYGGIQEQYIWLDANLIDDDTYNVELRWVISSVKGNTTNGLYCTIIDVNKAKDNDEDLDSLSNFDATNCKWRSITNATESNVKSAPYQCFNNLLNVPITFVELYSYQNSYITNYTGIYYELARGSSIYLQRDGVGVLKRDYIHKCNGDLYMVDSTCNASNINFILYDSLSNDISAYCDSAELSVKACNRWFIWNGAGYVLDTSFDVDLFIDDVLKERKALGEYSATLCFELNNSANAIYSPVQYLWGQYTKLDDVFDEKAMYQNERLKNTVFDTYLLWYNPKDSWVFVTTSHVLDHDAFDNFDVGINSLDNVIVAFCDNNDDNDNIFPFECSAGWTAADTLFNLSILSLNAHNESCSGVSTNITFTKTTDIKDLCVSFCENMDSKCEAPPYFKTKDWCNSTFGDCDEIDGNGIYTHDEDSIVLTRSYWVHEDGDDDNKVFYYVYYHEDLRLWIWSTDNGDYGDRVDNVDDLMALGIGAYCIKWDLDDPDQCDEFFYQELDTKKNASSDVKDCNINRDDSKDLIGTISAWIILSCGGLGCCVFFIGFYREYMQKRHQKKASRVSRITNIIEENDNEKEELNRVVSAENNDAESK